MLSAREFVDTVTGDLLGQRVFVFTPTGEVMHLPQVLARAPPPPSFSAPDLYESKIILKSSSNR